MQVAYDKPADDKPAAGKSKAEAKAEAKAAKEEARADAKAAKEDKKAAKEEAKAEKKLGRGRSLGKEDDKVEASEATASVHTRTRWAARPP